MNPLIFNSPQKFDSPIIVALDLENELEVMKLVSNLDPSLCKLKVGKELFTTLGPKIVEKLVLLGYKVFLDLKFHDIPNTVYKACKAASNLNIWMLNVHASGGLKMLEKAREGVDDSKFKPLLISVTMLTSMSLEDLKQIGVYDNLEDHVINLAKLSYQANFDGVVCSPLEAKLIKERISEDFITVTPGIRLIENTSDDQIRVMTPLNAIKNKSDYLVIGRPITKSINPLKTLQKIYDSLMLEVPNIKEIKTN